MLRLGLLVGFAAALLPSTASAATVSRGGDVSYQAAVGEVNDLIVAETAADRVFTENRGVTVIAEAAAARARR